MSTGKPHSQPNPTQCNLAHTDVSILGESGIKNSDIRKHAPEGLEWETQQAGNIVPTINDPECGNVSAIEVWQVT